MAFQGLLITIFALITLIGAVQVEYKDCGMAAMIGHWWRDI